MRLAEALQQHILRNNPDARVTQTQIDKWAIEADRMIRLDGRTEGQIRDLIHWSQHHPFWHKNILSMGKLREQFDRLTLEARGSKQNTDECSDESDDLPLGRPQWPGLSGDESGGRP